MLQRLIDFLVVSEAGRAFSLTLQDIAICQLGLSAGEVTDPSARQGLEDRVRRWCENPDMQDLNTAGRRHQNVIRELLQLLANGRIDSMSGDEAALLLVCKDLIGQCPDPSRFARIQGPVQDNADTLATRKAERGFSPGLATLGRRITYVTEADIQGAPQSHVRILAGIELPCRGPVFTAAGHLRILGDVPDNCTVVAENNGYCCVDGYVMGRILSKKQCEIRYNISGVAIVLDGHIRARSIINNATAIAKMGSVVCRNAQGPKLVFAGKSIHVAESTMMGKFVTRDMAVGKDVRGSRLEIAGEGNAEYFRHLGTSSVSIVLRRELSCEDFGEVTGAELNRLLSQAYKLRRRARNFMHLAEASRHEANHTAQSVLMVIFGGGEVQKRLEGFLRAQRRFRFVSNVVDNLRSMLDFAADGARGEDDEDLSSGGIEPEEALDSEDEDLKAARADAAKLRNSLRARALDRGQAKMIVAEIREKLAAMQKLKNLAAAQMAEEERAIQNLEKYEQFLAGSGKEATKLDVLNRILPALQQQPENSTMGKRIRASYVTRALRSIERTVRHANEFEQKARENLSDFRAVSERLGKDFQVQVLENPEDEQSSARVTGRFEAGIRIFMDQYAENLAELPKDSVHTTPQDDGIRTYVRNSDGSRFYSSED